MKKITFLVAALGLLSFFSCQNDPEQKEPEVSFEITTDAATNVTYESAEVSGSVVVTTGEATISEAGVCYSSTEQLPTVEGDKAVAELAADGTFTVTLGELDEDTKYYARTYVVLDEGAQYGSVVEFTTLSKFVRFDDELFEAYCLATYDADADGKLSVEEAASVTDRQFLGGKGYTSVKGIEAFVNVAELELWGNNLTSVNLSGMSKLTSLWIQNNPLLESIDVTGCNSLVYFEAHTNAKLASADLSNLPVLETVHLHTCPVLATVKLDNSGATTVYCGNNPALAELTVSGCNRLVHLECWSSSLQSLDLSNLKGELRVWCQMSPLLGKLLCASSNLVRIEAWQNSLYNIDFSGCAKLQEAYVQDQTTTASASIKLDGCVELLNLQAQNNKLKSIDASSCVKLVTLWAFNNDLQNYNINGCVSLTNSHIYDNPSLESLIITNAPLLTDMNANNCPLYECNISGAATQMNLFWVENSQLESITMKTGQTVTDLRPADIAVNYVD